MAEISSVLLSEIARCVARDAIREVLARYCRAVDRCDEDLLRLVYWPEAVDHHGTFDGGVEALIEWAWPQLRALDQTHHHISNPSIELDGRAAAVETYWTGYHRVKPESGGPDHLVGGRYLDRMEERDGEWRISERTTTYDWFTTTQNFPWESFAFGRVNTLAARKPEDWVYRFSPLIRISKDAD